MDRLFNTSTTIEEMHLLATSRKGECLSEKYTNSSSKLKWKCQKGHIWEAIPRNVKFGQWCPNCAGTKKLTIEEMKLLAKNKSGSCLSEKYINSVTKLIWKCADGHIWEATPASIQSGSWCHYCAGNKRLTLFDMQMLAEKKGGKCLSEKYINSGTRLIWKCADGHIWEATPRSVRSKNSWCPYCGFSRINENICREIFEQIFKKKFPKVKPDWLINSKGNKMELDGFNKGLKIAFEYNGIQHYKAQKYFSKNINTTLEQRKQDDQLKIEQCIKNGVKLVVIPYTIELDDFYNFIYNTCLRNQISILKNENINVKELALNFHLKKLNELNEVANWEGGKLLSKAYLGALERHSWQCEKGHVWKATPASIKSKKSWCPICSGNIKLTIEEMQNLATMRKGKCLSVKYLNARTKLDWQCEKGHSWKATPEKIKHGQWCPFCAGYIKLRIEEMQELAKKRNGKCLSVKYLNARTNLEWQCEKGHIWEATAGGIKSGSWCAKCSQKKRRGTY